MRCNACAMNVKKQISDVDHIIFLVECHLDTPFRHCNPLSGSMSVIKEAPRGVLQYSDNIS